MCEMKIYKSIMGKQFWGIIITAVIFSKSGSVVHASDFEMGEDETYAILSEEASEISANRIEEVSAENDNEESDEESFNEFLGDGALDVEYSDDEAEEDKEEKDEAERVTVSGNIIGYAGTEPFDIVFKYGDDVVRTTVIDGWYSAELFENRYYYVYIPDAKDFCLYSEDNDAIWVNSSRKSNDIPVAMLDKFWVLGEIYGFSSIADYNVIDEVLSNACVTFEKDGFYEEFDADFFGYRADDLPVGDYIVTLKSKDGNVYAKEKASFWYRISNGYCLDYDVAAVEPFSFDIDVKKGDYSKRNRESRISCDFEGAEIAELSSASFWFVDSDNNRSNEYSCYELNAGLAWIPNGNTYRIAASGLPEGMIIDYVNMSNVNLLEEQQGGEIYNYIVKFDSIVHTPLTIVKDTEDITTAKIGKRYTFTIDVEGTDLKYCWYYKNPGKSKFSKAGVYTSEYSRHATKDLDGMQVYCVVTDGNGEKVVGRTATLNIRKQNIVLTYPNSKKISVAVGKKAIFAINAVSDTHLSYKWYYRLPKYKEENGVFHSTGCYSDSYTRTATKSIDGLEAYCVVTDANGKAVKSDIILLEIKK